MKEKRVTANGIGYEGTKVVSEILEEYSTLKKISLGGEEERKEKEKENE